MKKFLALTLAVLMVLGMFSGCQTGGKDETTATTAATESLQTPEEAAILRVLVIGNSHTIDATSMLAEVFAAEMPKQKIMIGSMYHSGCSVNSHVAFANNNTVSYTYYKNEERDWTPQIATTNNTATLADGVGDQCWDIVVLNEMNGDAVMETQTYADNYSNLKKLVDYVNTNTQMPPKFLWHLGWANPTDADYLAQGDSITSTWSSSYKTYSNGDYTTMFSNMANNAKKYIFENETISDAFDGLIPAGTALCYARNELNLTDKDLYRDYTHLSNLGRLITAYVWYATITGQESISEVNIDYVPGSLCAQNTDNGFFQVTDTMKQAVIKAVNFALDNPYTASKAAN